MRDPYSIIIVPRSIKLPVASQNLHLWEHPKVRASTTLSSCPIKMIEIDRPTFVTKCGDPFEGDTMAIPGAVASTTTVQLQHSNWTAKVGDQTLELIRRFRHAQDYFLNQQCDRSNVGSYYSAFYDHSSYDPSGTTWYHNLLRRVKKSQA